MNSIEKYLNEIKNYKEGVYIFGAGHVAGILSVLLDEKGIVIKAFLVSDTEQNKTELRSIPVKSADMRSINRENPVLVGVLERGEKHITRYLHELGYTKVIELPDGILEYDYWEYRRVRTPIIEVTAKIGCAVNCKYCPQQLLVDRYFSDNRNRKQTMTFDEYCFYLDRCPKETIVDFSGFVEPFLVEDSVSMMEYTYRTGHEMTLFTTLRGLTVKQAETVIRMPFRYVCLHTPDKDGYANIPMTDQYFTVLQMFLDAKKEDGSPFVDVANCQSIPHAEIIDITKGRLKIYCEMSDRAGNLDESDPVLTHVKHEGEIVCSRTYGLNHNVLLPDGSLVLCCNDFGLENIIGNLNQQTYTEIMQSEKLRAIKRAMHICIDDYLICRKCMFARNIEKR